MKDLNIIGQYRVGNRTTIYVNRKCNNCPLLDYSLKFCTWYKRRLNSDINWSDIDADYSPDFCRVIEIIVEE